MSDFGSTTFGYAIAYLLPGLAAAVGGGLLSSHVGVLFTKVIDEQNLPLGLMGALAALALGVFLSLFRALIFEEWLWRSERLSADDYASLADDEQTFNAYHRMIDEVYRFHQFWGGMALAIPVLCLGAVSHNAIGDTERIAVALGSLLFEAAAIWAAIATYKRYLIRVQKVLQTGVPREKLLRLLCRRRAQLLRETRVRGRRSRHLQRRARASLRSLTPSAPT